MTEMTVIYQTPDNEAFFDKHYFEVHVPLAKRLPGLLKYEVSKGVVGTTTGHDDVYLVGHLYFETMEAMRNAFASDIGRECAADRRILAPNNDDIQIYLYDTHDV